MEMCDILNDLRGEHDEIELEKYGTIIAAPKVNVYLFCCAKCHDMFRQMEKFIEHIKQEHVKSNTINSLSVPSKETAIQQEYGSTLAQRTIASKVVSLPHEGDKVTADIPNIESPLEDLTQAFNGQQNIAVAEEGMENENWFEITTIKEELVEELVENSEGAIVQNVSPVKQKPFEIDDRGVTNYNTEEPETPANEDANVQQNEKGYIEKQLSSTVLKRDVAITTDLLATSKRPKICKCCNKSFRSYTDLKVHIDSKTVALDVFNCEICHYTAVNRLKLERHMASHSVTKPYKCTFCHYAAKRLYDLQRHARVHTEVRDFVCDICQKAFIRSSQLKYHMDSHFLKYLEKK